MNRFKYKIKSEKGVISIFIVILLPVIILGGLSLFDYLHVYQQENMGFKVAYACSDTALSQYNAFLYDSFALYANHNVTDLSALITLYFEQNGLIDKETDFNIEVDYDALDQIATYSQAIKDASVTQMGNVAANYTLELFDQLEVSGKIKKLSDQFKVAEIKLAERFELESYKSALDKMVKENDFNLNLETLRNEAIKGFQLNMEQLTIDFNNLSEANQSLLEPYKLSEWQATNQAFLERMGRLEAFEADLSTLKSEIAQYEIMIQQLQVEMFSIESALESCDDESRYMELEDQIAGIRNELMHYEANVAEVQSEIVQLAKALQQSLDSEKPNIINDMQALMDEIAERAMGVEIEEGQLNLEEKYNYEKKTDTLDNWPLHEKLLVNEYYLSLFSSYDLECPRAMDPLNRFETERVLKGEIEYILTGVASEKDSVNWVIAQMVALRLPMNLMSLLSDGDKMRTISKYTIALPQPWRTVAYTAILTAWVSAESYLDVMALMKGEGISFAKSSSEWHLDLEAFMNRKWQSKVSEKSTNKLYYQDYLRLLLFFQSEDTSLKRVMSLMTVEIQEASKGIYDLSHFSKGHHIQLDWQPYSIFGRIKKRSTLSLKNNLSGYLGTNQ